MLRMATSPKRSRVRPGVPSATPFSQRKAEVRPSSRSAARRPSARARTAHGPGDRSAHRGGEDLDRVVLVREEVHQGEVRHRPRADAPCWTAKDALQEPCRAVPEHLGDAFAGPQTTDPRRAVREDASGGPLLTEIAHTGGGKHDPVPRLPHRLESMLLSEEVGQRAPRHQHRGLGQALRLGAVHRAGVGGHRGGAEERVPVEALHHPGPMLIEVLGELGTRLREAELDRGSQRLGVAPHRVEQLVGGGETACESQSRADQRVVGGAPHSLGVQLVGGDAVPSLRGERRHQAKAQCPRHAEPAVQSRRSVLHALHLLQDGGHAVAKRERDGRSCDRG